MSSYKLPRIAELAHQLRLSPGRLRLQQVLAADHLLTLIEPDHYYPYSWVCWHITGYRPAGGDAEPADLRGAALADDLLALCLDITKQNPIPEAALPWPASAIPELAERLNVSPKTIRRWRDDGLPAWWIVRHDGEVRLAVPERGLRRFVAAHRDVVLRSRRFSQMSDTEHEQVLERAQQLQASGASSIHSICHTLAAETGRSVETIRYTLQKHEPQWLDGLAANPASAQVDDHPIIYQCWRAGDTIEALALRFDKTVRTIRRIILSQRRRRLLTFKFTYVYSPEFDLPDAEAQILAEDDAWDAPRRCEEPAALPADGLHPDWLVNSGAEEPLAPAREQAVFRRYNYCKFRLAQAIQALRRKATAEALDEAEQWRSRIETARQTLVESNLKLVTSVARRHLRYGATLEELASEGNMILMRAIEKFDYTRGFKFSTYATWALMKHFARLVPLWQANRRRQQTGCDEVLKDVHTDEAVSESLDRQLLGGLLHNLLELLPRRERKVIEWHYGLLEDASPRSLTQIADRLGVSKERVRQIEMRGLKKLREMLAERKFQYQ